MKKSIFAFGILALCCSLLITSCNSKPKQEQHDALQKDSAELVVYACSMHPEVTGKEGDKCSKCGMKLEAVKSADSTNRRDH